jgi:transposase
VRCHVRGETIMIPESIKSHKPSGSEIRSKNGRYYVYKVEGYYDKEAHKSKSRSLGCIGQIYENIGFVPNKKKSCASEFITKEYGATQIALTAGTGLFDTLRECFPSEFIRIYVMAVLKLLGNLSSKDIGIAYGKSAISLLLPEVHLSKNTVSDFLCRLSAQREGMLRFMRSYADCGSGGIIFDGTSFLSGSRCNPFCEKGYSPGHIWKSRMRLIYAYDRAKHEPIYFKVVPGSASDKTAFETCLDEIGGKNFTVILDKGFFSEKNINLMKGTEFIMPLQKNTVLVPAPLKLFSGYERTLRNSFSYHNRIVYFIEPDAGKYDGCKVCVYYDCERRQHLMENYFRKAREKDGSLSAEAEKSAATDTASFGVTMLIMSMKSSPRHVYLDYKTRWAIEEMFNTHTNTLGFDMKYETKYETQEGWAFIEFLALLLYHKINGMLISGGLIKSFSVKDLLYRAATVTQSKAGSTWKVCNMSNPLKDMFQGLGVSIETIP